MAELRYAELVETTKRRWSQLNHQDKSNFTKRILQLRFIARVVLCDFYFQPGYGLPDVEDELKATLHQFLGSGKLQLRYHYREASPAAALNRSLANPQTFSRLTFGSDLAERDTHLLDYFITTDAYTRVLSGEKSLVIGPKGSGKSAILRVLMSDESTGYSVAITPEVFATSALKQYTADTEGALEDDEAFISTWIFTILFEVFKRICANPRGIPPKYLRNVKAFVADNSAFAEVDLFTRFVSRLKRISGIKLGNYELSIKTRELQKLYALEGLYEIIPDLRAGLREDMLILIDELDQGWDNSTHSNVFIASLLQAAYRIARLDLPIRVVVFIRSEIFDLVKARLDQLDKLRAGIEVIRWSAAELATLLLKRVGYSVGVPIDSGDTSVLRRVFGEPCRGMFGFDYVVSRTTRRPRELLQFVRRAHEIAVAGHESTITSDTLLKAEEEFSNWKLQYISSEYRHIYPGVEDLLAEFRGFGPLLSPLEVEEILLRYISRKAELAPWAQRSTEAMVQVLYTVEFLGAEKPGRGSKTKGVLDRFDFAYDRPATNAGASTAFVVHPGLWSALELQPIST